MIYNQLSVLLYIHLNEKSCVRLSISEYLRTSSEFLVRFCIELIVDDSSRLNNILREFTTWYVVLW